MKGLLPSKINNTRNKLSPVKNFFYINSSLIGKALISLVGINNIHLCNKGHLVK